MAAVIFFGLLYAIKSNRAAPMDAKSMSLPLAGAGVSDGGGGDQPGDTAGAAGDADGDACDAGDAGDAHHFQKLRRMMFSTRTSSVRASASLSSGSPGIALYEEDWPGSASEC